MKKILLILSFLLVGLLIFGSSCVTGSYSAVGMTESKSNNKVNFTFMSLKGNKVYSLKCKNGSECILEYYGKIESGSITVYYSVNGERTELFTLNGGEEVDSSIGSIPVGSISLIIESRELSKNGSFKFQMK